jgi:hypothetical protein
MLWDGSGSGSVPGFGFDGAEASEQSSTLEADSHSAN